MAELALGRPAEAEKAFRRAIELRADWPLPITSLGSLLSSRGEFAEAEKLLDKAVTLEPHNAAALTALAEVRINNKAAPPVLEDLLTKVSILAGKANSTAGLWTAKAALENYLKKRPAAKVSIARAMALDAGNRDAMFLSAEIALSEGDLEKAKVLSARLSETASDQAHLLRANVFAAEGNADEAIKALDSIKKPVPAATELRSRITAGRSTHTAELEKQIEKDPADPAVLGRLCTLFRRDDPAKALEYCRRASEAEPTNANHAVGFAAALVQAKQYETAVTVLKKILEIVPDNFTARANLATALFQLQRFPEARIEFSALTEAQPRSAGAYLFLGIIYDQAGEYMDAMANYQQYLRLADKVAAKLDIERVNLRLPALQKLIRDGKGKKNQK
jgi:Flp pilus assembly protein TadD